MAPTRYSSDLKGTAVWSYPAEAMLALSEAEHLTTDKRYLESVERAFSYYISEYYEKGRVEPETLV